MIPLEWSTWLHAGSMILTMWIVIITAIIREKEAKGLMDEIKKKGKRVIISTGPAREEDFEDIRSSYRKEAED